MKKFLIVFFNFFLLFSNMNYQIVNAEEESSTDNTSLTTEESDTNTSNEENSIQENDSTNESDELTINDLSEDETISTIANSPIQILYTTELKTLLNNINVTDLYFGIRSDYPAVDFTTYTKYNLKNSYELYYHLDSSTGLSEAYVISSNDEHVVFPESCSSMFAKLTTLKRIHFDNINTEYVTNMHGMFADCNNLTYVDISKFNTINVKDMSYMFANCNNLSSIDASNFNTNKVTNMLGMFSNCQKLAYIDVSKFNTENVTNMSWMFASCKSLPFLNVSNFNTEKVTNMEGMFSNLNVTTLDLSSFKTEHVTNMGRMFISCKNLNTIYATTDFIAPSNSENMFSGCTSLKGEKSTKYSSNKKNEEYARTDGGTDSPGYFSVKHPDKPTLSNDTYTYNGSEQSATVTGFDSSSMKIDGNVQTNAGTHTITVTPVKQWSDGSTDSLTIQWVIEKATATVPDGLKAAQGEKLSDIPLPEGWSWDEPDTLLSAGDSQKFKASYTPTDPINYIESKNVDLTVDVEAAPDKPTNNTSNKKPNGWDDGGPFTTDKCGNVFDRWNNKIYEANGCNVGGYNLVRTSVVD